MIDATNSISNASYINSFNARNAFQTQVKPKQEEKPEEETGISMKTIDDSVLNRVDVDELQKYATKTTESLLSNDDIKYGLIFGRSVLIDCQA